MFNSLCESPPNRASLLLVIKVRKIIGQMITLFPFQVSVVPHQLIESTAKGEQDQRVDEEELDNINDHPSKGHLQRSQMRIYGEDVDQFKERKDHSSSKSSFGQQHWVVWIPFLSWKVWIQSSGSVSLHYVPGSESQTDPHDKERVGDKVDDIPEI